MLSSCVIRSGTGAEGEGPRVEDTATFMAAAAKRAATPASRALSIE